ncbi:MAG: DNA-binding protein [Gomphosphaeria aponina SAG 52.96 = DSM 107014]|uniref:DNA-binding protein n=1 Tax=Gomphosphaeria aponina SAG 52.96 = DSM 107014 TaxID=1521640 RepID=A0A941GV90_9CHRO|nr:DNA-binding protein [Gomphosphaeria aponina SAG 52.96 = DSM 107014]
MSRTINKKIEIPVSKKAAAEAIIQHLATLFVNAEKEHLESIARSLEPVRISEVEAQLAQEIAGADYTPEKMWHLELANLQKYYQRRLELLSGALSPAEVAQLLGWKSPQTPHDWAKNNQLLAIKDNGILKFPLAQFDPNGSDGVVNGLHEVLEALDNISAFSKLNWLMLPNAIFEGLTPLEMLKKGEVEKVVIEARAIAVY